MPTDISGGSTPDPPSPVPAERVYIFHGISSTQVLASAPYIHRIRAVLDAAGVSVHPHPPAHPEIAPRPYTDEGLQDPLREQPSPWARCHATVEELSVGLDREAFWERIEAGVWATWAPQWPAADGHELYPPRVPDWLLAAPRWELDPLAPALGPAAAGGWVRDTSAHTTGTGAAVGLFQLTDLESFWVFASAETLDRVGSLCEELGAQFPAFTWLTGYFDPSDSIGSLRLPIECAPELEFALAERGLSVDAWW